MAGKKVSDNTDEESKGILYDGANLSQLGVLFRMDHRVLVEKLHGVPPDGTRNRANIWKIDTVAPYLVKPIFEIEAYIKKMNHTELPKMITKEFWAGQRSRQEYELKAGDLWPTAKVVENVGEVLKIFKMSARLFVDAVDRQSELSEKQRKIIRNLTDGMLMECHQTVVDRFKKESPAATPAEPVVEDDDEI